MAVVCYSLTTLRNIKDHKYRPPALHWLWTGTVRVQTVAELRRVEKSPLTEEEQVLTSLT